MKGLDKLSENIQYGIGVQRKIIHILLGLLITVLLMFGVAKKIHFFSLIIISIIFSFLSRKYRIPVLHQILDTFEREKEIRSFPGKGFIFYLIGVFLVLSFFPVEIAMPSILVLAFADSVGYIFGGRFGKTPHPFTDKKFLEGFIAGIIAGFIGALIFVPWHEALAASFFAMVVEGIELKIGADEVDDNITIPLAAAIAISVVRFFF